MLATKKVQYILEYYMHSPLALGGISLSSLLKQGKYIAENMRHTNIACGKNMKHCKNNKDAKFASE